jgi:Tfp pilus assembly protein FimT
VVILGVLAALAGTNISAATERANQTSFNERVYALISDARNLALNRGHQVVVLVDLDTSANGSGGIFEFDDPGYTFGASAVGSWSRSYSSITSSPVKANTALLPGARMVTSLRFSSRGVQGHVDFASSTTLNTAGSYASLASLAGTPWPIPSGTGVNHVYSGAGCSFCNATAGIGYLLFEPDGSVRISDPSAATATQAAGAKGYIALSDPKRANRLERIIYVASPSALVHMQTAE